MEKLCETIWEITYPEVLKSPIPVCDDLGYMWGGPDRRVQNSIQANEVWAAWKGQVEGALKRGAEVPDSVKAYYENFKGCAKAPALEDATKLLNDNAALSTGGFFCATPDVAPPIVSKPFSWSFTGIDCFEMCPCKFAARWFYKTEVFEETEASRWGNRKHKADELALKGKTEEWEKGKQILLEKDIVDWKYVNLFLKVIQDNPGAKLLVEEEIAINREFKRVQWFDKTAYGRAKIDVGLIIGDKIKIYDWKTGKMKNEDFQLELFCLFAALAWPHLQHFTAQYIWLQDDKVSDAVVLTRPQILGIMKKTLDKVKRMEQAWDSQIFQQIRNGLCKNYCSVLTCPNNGRRS